MEDQVSCICEEHYDNFLHCPHCFNRLKKAEEIKAENKRLMEEVQQRQNYLKSVLGKINILEERMRVLSNKTEKTDPFRWSENVENDLLSKDLPSNFFNLCKDPELAMSFLVQSGTIPKTRKCDKCFTDSGAPDMKLENYGALGFSFRCPQCFAKSSVKEHTFWSRCQLSIEKILLFVFLWVLYVKDADVASLLDSTASHIASLSRKLRKLTCKDFLDNIPKFTGVVEIDEQNFVKRKIEIGKGKTPAKWVLIMHERHTKIEYMECLPKRDFQTILPIIQKRCEIGTIIVTDSYGVYGRLEDYGYPHYTFENSFAFQNQQNKELHIRGAMLSWNWVRYNVKKRNRAAKHLQEHIFEHLWRKRVKPKQKSQNESLDVAMIMRSILDLIAKENNTTLFIN